MSTVFSITLRIWARAVLLNALLIGGYVLIGRGFVGGVVFAIVLIVGFIVTAPLLIIINPLVKLVSKIPYNSSGRLAGLAFSLVLVALVFYSFAALLIGSNLVKDKEFHLVVLATSIAVVLAT